jgi:NitT/TauT family transport system substrate-binding protein
MPGERLRRIVCTAALLICLCAPAQADSLTVRVGSPSSWGGANAAPMYGVKLGFFAEEGIDPQFVSVDGSAILLPQIANGAIQFGMPNMDLLAIALDKKEPYPVKAFYNLYRSQVFEFVVLEDSPVRAIADLRGKKLGVGFLTWGNLPMTKVMLQDVGLTWMKDVQVVPVGIGPAAWRRLTSGDVAALNLYLVQHEMMAVAGTPIRRLPLPERFRHIFSNGLVANFDLIKSDPKLVEGFGRAWAKAQYACEINVEACVKAYWDFNPSARPPAEKEAEWVAAYVRINRAQMHIFRDGMVDDRWGDYDPQTWREFLKILHDGGQISREDLPVDELFTRQFVDGINAWDRATVRARAR